MFYLTVENAAFFDYLLDAYENKVIECRGKRGAKKEEIENEENDEEKVREKNMEYVIKKADSYFWYYVDKGIRGIINNPTMTLTFQDVERRLEIQYGLSQLHLMERVKEFESFILSITELSVDNSENSKLFGEIAEIVEESTEKLIECAMKSQEYRCMQLKDVFATIVTEQDFVKG